jgi:hydroxyacylglutathione hydrolase
VTHHLADRRCTVEELRSRSRGQVFVPRHARVAQPRSGREEDHAHATLGLAVGMLGIFARTAGHTAYPKRADDGASIALSGDTLLRTWKSELR